MPSRAAAPEGPNTRPPLARNASLMPIDTMPLVGMGPTSYLADPSGLIPLGRPDAFAVAAQDRTALFGLPCADNTCQGLAYLMTLM